MWCGLMVFLGSILSGYLSHPSCNTHIDDVIRSNIPTVFSVFLFLSVSTWLLDSSDAHGRGRGGSVLSGQLHHPQTFLISVALATEMSPTFLGNKPRELTGV